VAHVLETGGKIADFFSNCGVAHVLETGEKIAFFYAAPSDTRAGSGTWETTSRNFLFFKNTMT
jgi:hypothetical protein